MKSYWLRTAGMPTCIAASFRTALSYPPKGGSLPDSSKRRGCHRVAPQQRDAPAVVLHVHEGPRQLIDGIRQLVELHRHAHDVLVRRVAIRAPQCGLVGRIELVLRA